MFASNCRNCIYSALSVSFSTSSFLFATYNFCSYLFTVLSVIQGHYYSLMHMCGSCSWVQLFVALWTVAHQDPLSMGFSRQEYWSGLPCSPPGDLPDPGIEPMSLTSPSFAGGFFTTSANKEAHSSLSYPRFCIISKLDKHLQLLTLCA